MAFQQPTRKLLAQAGPQLFNRSAKQIGDRTLVSKPTTQRERLCTPTPCAKAKQRYLSTTGLVSPEGIVRSPYADVDLPDFTLHDFLFGFCDQYGDMTAIEDFMTGKSYTYAEVKSKSLQVANSLHKLGYRKGDVVIAFAPSLVDYTVAFLATIRLGMVFSAYNPTAPAEDLSHALKQTGSKAVFTVPQLFQTVQSAVQQTGNSAFKDIIVFGPSTEGAAVPFDSLLEESASGAPNVDINPQTQVAAQIFSSGTTGRPKGVQLSHSSFVWNLQQLKHSMGWSDNERHIGILPFYHIGGMLASQCMPLVHGCHIIYIPMFQPDMFLNCLQDKKVNQGTLVPPLVHFLATFPGVEKYDLSNLNRIACGAAPLSRALINKVMERIPSVANFDEVYGMSEVMVVTLNRTATTSKSVGHLLPNTFAKVIDSATGAALGPEQEGELCIKGPQTMLGYLNNPEATQDMVTPDGWVKTGDVGYYTEDGAVFVTDRNKDLIKYKASQVPPAELEDLLHQHPDIVDAAVVGIPDEEAGEVPKAFVVKSQNSSVTEEDIVEFIRGKTSKNKWLRGGVTFLEAIPKLPSGKILKRVLREYKA